MIKIASVCPYFYGGGAEVLWGNIISKMRNEICFEHFISEKNRIFHEDFARNFPIKPKFISDEDLSDIDADLVFSWGPVFLKNRPKSKWVFFAHSEVSEKSFKIIESHCKFHVAISRFVKRKIFKGRNSLIIPCGVQSDRVCFGKSLRSNLGFLETDFVVGFVGTFSQSKHYDKVIDAVKKLPNNFKCLMVGKLDSGVEPIKQCDKIKCIQIPNNNISSAYATVDCVVLPSINEGLPQVMWESMANKKPFLTTASGSQIDFVIDKFNCLVVESNSDSIKYCCDLIYKDSNLKKFITDNAYELYSKYGTFDFTIKHFKKSVEIFSNMKVF